MRCELDEGSEEDPVKKLQAWEESTFKVLQNLPSVDTAPVCDWTSPECKILEKTEDDLRREAALKRLSKMGGVRVC